MGLSYYNESTTTLKSNFFDCFKIPFNGPPISLLSSHYSLMETLYENIVKLILHLFAFLFMHLHTSFYSLYLFPSFKISLKKSPPRSFLHSSSS